MSKEIPDIETLEKENTVLKARCAVLTKGLLCAWCEMECKSRAHKYDENYIPEDKNESNT